MPQPPDEQPKPRSETGKDAGPSLPVFFDAHSRRWPLVVRLGVPVALLVAAATVTLLVSAFAVVFMPRSPLPRVQIVSDIGNMEPILGEHTRRKLAFAQARDVQRLKVLQAREARAKRTRARKAQAFLAAHAPAQPATVLVPTTNAPAPVVAGFYVNWEETSPVSVHRHITALTHFIPEWLHLKASGYNYANTDPRSQPFVDARQRALDKNDITPFVRAHGVPILPLINNYTQPPGADESAADWDTRAVHSIVSSAKARTQVIAHLKAWLLKNQMQGINVDFEEVDTDDKNGLTLFMTQLWQALHPLGLLVTEDVEVGSGAYDLPKLAAVTNWIVPMLYDEHAGGTAPGAVAGVDWTVQNLRKILQQVPASKIVMGVGNHGYDWISGTTTAEDLTFQSAIITAKESQPDAVIHIAPGSLNPTYQYADVEVDQHGNQRELDHVVWMQDAVSVYNQLLAAKPYGVRGAALWFMGAEDPTIWSFLNKANWNANWTSEVQSGILNTVSYGGQAEVDFEGDGELLQPVANPSDGHRTLIVAPDTGLITNETYAKDPATGQPMLPSASVVRRYGGGSGNPDKRILLTFDDGPDPTYTPEVLDILQKYHVPAVFFVVGRNAEAWPDDVRREWDMGDDIGNHSWSHPDLFELSREAQVLQLNTTQRVIQAITGHSTTLFRPPYGGDVEPQTAAEVEPMILAAKLGYITVGETNDPQDWRLFEL
ncbi:MAG: polysaccharide deacetylase family protein, partial [Armatimonadetes bacterium]|nr:polysaccharide deacetylase family protein [Armatimonadota bacterium]